MFQCKHTIFDPLCLTNYSMAYSRTKEHKFLNIPSIRKYPLQISTVFNIYLMKKGIQKLSPSFYNIGYIGDLLCVTKIEG